MSELTSLTNIGKEMASKLISVGIDTPEKLSEDKKRELKEFSDKLKGR